MSGFSAPPPQYNQRWLASITADFDRRLSAVERPVGGTFVVSNANSAYTLDADTATATDVANFLAALIDELQKRGMIR